jgi:dimethylargininase
MLVALTREVSPAIARCELTHLVRDPIDLDRARAQHAEYEACLARAGCRVERLAAGPDMPDSVFVEDTAVVFDEVAIVTRPGAVSRRVETSAVAEVLRPYRPLFQIDSPGTVDGGDVLVVGRTCFVGRSSRTNDAGIAQMRGVLAPYGYRLTAIEVHGCLHLKSAVTAVGDDLLLINSAWLPSAPFGAFDRIDVHADEPAAANALSVGGQIIYSTAFPRTRERLERRGLRILAVDATEVAKAEGAVTCCSVIFESREPTS